MEQPCYKCGQAVEQGVAFCPHCSAPQIRVVIAEAATAGVAFPDATVKSEDSVASPSVPMLAISSPWSLAVKPCIFAAFVAFLLVLLRLNLVVAMLAAGFLAVVFYRQRRPGIPLTASDGAKLGALAGLLCSSVISLFIALAATVPDARTTMRDQLIEGARKLAAWLPADSNVQALIDQLKTPRGFAVVMIQGMIGLFIFSIILASLGGAIGGAVFRRRDKP